MKHKNKKMRLFSLKYILVTCLTLWTAGLILALPSFAEGRGLTASNNAPIYMRIFKSEGVLELWHKTGNQYQLYKSYKICKWSGRLGPKQMEGDKQSPEGFYTLTSGQLGWYTSKWRESFNVGFPNNFDIAQKRTGTNILIHGGCSSVGCYAMTNKAMHEIYNFIATKVENGQQSIPLHIFPFRMTQENMAKYALSPWHSFWQTLKPAYDLFEKNRTPPVVQVCSGRYKIQSRKPASAQRALLSITNRRLAYRLTHFTPKLTTEAPKFSKICKPVQAQWVAKRQARHPAPRRGRGLYRPARDELAYRGKRMYPRLGARARRFIIRCNISKPSCKRWVFLKTKRVRKIRARSRHRTARTRTAKRRSSHKRRYSKRKSRRVVRRKSKRRRRVR